MDLNKMRDAARLDITTLLSKEEPGIFEFRGVENIAAIMCRLVDGNGTPWEQGTVVRSINECEHRYPTLHDALLGRAFDTDGLLRAKYRELQEYHKQLKVAKLGVEDAAARMDVELAAIAVGKKALKATAESLVRERERLGLLAEETGVKVNLPDIPQLPAVLELDKKDEEEE